jgi:hypothetical protein
MGFAEVSTILWQERHLLELLQFKLDEQQLLLAAERARYLAFAGAEIERVLEELRHVELVRAIEVDTLAESLGLQPSPSLAELAEASPPPWGALFAQHRAALQEQTDDIRAIAATNRSLLVNGEAALRELLGADEPPDVYGTERARGGGRRLSLLVDQVV